MTDVTMLEGEFRAEGARFAVVVSRFNSFVVENLLTGAMDALTRHGVARSDITVVRVPGAWEIPLTAQRLAATRRFDAIVAVGAVIRGGTPHFEYVAGETVKGLAQVTLAHGVPIGFGVLTVDSIEQAIERAGTKMGNKGWEAAQTMLEMADLCRGLKAGKDRK